MALGAGSLADRVDVSVGAAEYGLTRQITSVAAGTEDTDAVNVGQLKGVAAVADATAKRFQATGSSNSDAGALAEGDEALAAGEAANAIGNGTTAVARAPMPSHRTRPRWATTHWPQVRTVPRSATMHRRTAPAASPSVVCGGCRWQSADHQWRRAGGNRRHQCRCRGTAVGASAEAGGFAASSLWRWRICRGAQSSAFGAVANAIGDYSTALGTQSNATGTSSVAIGGPADLIPGLGFFVQTQASGERRPPSARAIASGDRAVANGSLTEASGAEATAVGYCLRTGRERQRARRADLASGAHRRGYATARGANSVALGANSEAVRANSVAVGSAGNERQITSRRGQ